MAESPHLSDDVLKKVRELLDRVRGELKHAAHEDPKVLHHARRYRMKRLEFDEHEVKDFYNLRSKIVYGVTLDTKLRERLNALDSLREVVRRVLLSVGNTDHESLWKTIRDLRQACIAEAEMIEMTGWSHTESSHQ